MVAAQVFGCFVAGHTAALQVIDIAGPGLRVVLFEEVWFVRLFRGVKFLFRLVIEVDDEARLGWRFP